MLSRDGEAALKADLQREMIILVSCKAKVDDFSLEHLDNVSLRQ